MTLPSANLYPGSFLFPNVASDGVLDGEFNDPEDNWVTDGDATWNTHVLRPDTTTRKSARLSTGDPPSTPSISHAIDTPYAGELSFWAFSDTSGAVIRVYLDTVLAYTVELTTEWDKYYLPVTINTSIKFELYSTTSAIAFIDDILPSIEVDPSTLGIGHTLYTYPGNNNTEIKKKIKHTTTLTRRSKCQSILEETH